MGLRRNRSKNRYSFENCYWPNEARTNLSNFKGGRIVHEKIATTEAHNAQCTIYTRIKSIKSMTHRTFIIVKCIHLQSLFNQFLETLHSQFLLSNERITEFCPCFQIHFRSTLENNSSMKLIYVINSRNWKK